MLVYHDRFPDLQEEIVELLRTPLVSLLCVGSHDRVYYRLVIVHQWRTRLDN